MMMANFGRALALSSALCLAGSSLPDSADKELIIDNCVSSVKVMPDKTSRDDKGDRLSRLVTIQQEVIDELNRVIDLLDADLQRAFRDTEVHSTFAREFGEHNRWLTEEVEELRRQISFLESQIALCQSYYPSSSPYSSDFCQLDLAYCQGVIDLSACNEGSECCNQ